MAILEVKVPQLSESVAEATLLQWHKKVGEAVTRDENLIDIETDKVVLELPAPDAGVITEILKADGSTVVAGEVIAMIDTEASAGAVARRSRCASRRCCTGCRACRRPGQQLPSPAWPRRRPPASPCLPPRRCWPKTTWPQAMSPAPAATAA